MRIPLSYIIKRVGFLVAVLFTAATINFLIPKLAPRDPVQEMIQQKIASGGLRLRAPRSLGIPSGSSTASISRWGSSI